MKPTEIAHTLALILSADNGLVPALVVVFIVLVGPMLVPIVVFMARHAARLAVVLVRRVAQYVVDKIIESIIVGTLTLFGWLWMLEMLPSFVR